MLDIIVGEKVINNHKEIGTITSFDSDFLIVNYETRVAKIILSAFEKRLLRYQNEELQSKVEKIIEQARIEEEQRAKEKKIILDKKNEELKRKNEERKLVVRNKEGEGFHFMKVLLWLDPKPLNLKNVAKKDKEIIQQVFNECDKDTKEVINLFDPKMTYPKYTSRSRSKYSVGFLCKYLNVYVLRVFSRNDIYKKRVTTGITVMESYTTETIRILSINGNIYSFSKNIGFDLGHYNISPYHDKWHIYYADQVTILDDVIRVCDCKYLNDYIAEKQINCCAYAKLLMAALYNNKAEIVFKNKLFLSTYRINNITNYLDEFTSKQIDFASKNDVVNALPFIKGNGLYDLDILRNLEIIMKNPGRFWEMSIYNSLKYRFEERNFDLSILNQKLIHFLKRIDYFNARIYSDYIEVLKDYPNLTIDDLFDKDYLRRHDIMMTEKHVHYSIEDVQKYDQVYQELRWIDREENGYYIIVPKNIPEFKYEGDEQHNCVFVLRYFRSVIKHYSIIVFLRKEIDKSYVTIEFDYETFEVMQAFGKYNKEIDNNLYNYIVDLGKRLYYEKLSQQ